MPKRPPIKMWDKPRKIEVITPSKYEVDDPAVKVYWKNYIRELELSYKDDKFWETNVDFVRRIVPTATFKKLAKIYDLPIREQRYFFSEDDATPVPSAEFYNKRDSTVPRVSRIRAPVITQYSSMLLQDFAEEELGEDLEMEVESTFGSIFSDEDETVVSLGPTAFDGRRRASTKSVKSVSSLKSRRSSRSISICRGRSKSLCKLASKQTLINSVEDDMRVNLSASFRASIKRKSAISTNPHHAMLRTGKLEKEMITWPSRYLQRDSLQVSASEDFTKKADALTKKIAKEFFDWYTALGEVEFKSELKRPEDIEQLFQVWFDEHASRGIVIDPKVLPCVLESVAIATGAPHLSCHSALERQVSYDILAEGTPARTVAFGTGLPARLKHVPPRNNTAAQWRGVRVPEDLATMSCVWDEITHLTSTKEFENYLRRRRHLAMPPYLRSLGKPAAAGRKSLFVVPSDFVPRGVVGEDSTESFTLRVSKFSLELNSEISRLMN